MVLKALAGNDEVKRVVVESGGVELILAAMSKHAKSPVIQELGCAAIATISLRNPTHCLRVMTNNGPEVILKSMQLHPDEMAVQVGVFISLNTFGQIGLSISLYANTILLTDFLCLISYTCFIYLRNKPAWQ